MKTSPPNQPARHPSVTVLKADLDHPAHQAAVLALIDAYAAGL